MSLNPYPTAFVPIDCYNGECFFLPVLYQGKWIAEVIYKDPEIQEIVTSNIYFDLSKEQKPYWVYVPEWEMYRSNISTGRIYKPLF